MLPLIIMFMFCTGMVLDGQKITNDKTEIIKNEKN
jgi:hypothetical protein